MAWAELEELGSTRLEWMAKSCVTPRRLVEGARIEICYGAIIATCFSSGFIHQNEMALVSASACASRFRVAVGQRVAEDQPCEAGPCQLLPCFGRSSPLPIPDAFNFDHLTFL